MNTQTEPFAGRLLSEHALEKLLDAICFAEAGQRTIGTGRDCFTVTRAGEHVVVNLPSERRFLLALRAGIPYKGVYPLTPDDIDAAFLLPSLEGEPPPPRRLVVPGTVPLRPTTPAELLAAVDMYRQEMEHWNHHETSADLPLLQDVIRGIRLVDTAPNARGVTFELLDIDGAGSGLYVALETVPGWRKWRGPLLSFRRAVLAESDVLGGTLLIDPRAHLAAMIRRSCREIH